MINELDLNVSDINVLRSGFVARNGYIFVLGEKPAVYDTLLIRAPENAVGAAGKAGFSDRTLEEHIELVNRYQLNKAKIICRDLKFILRCPSLNQISIHPDYESGDEFDYSPLYQMTGLRSVCCITKYGFRDQYQCTVDYSRMRGLKEIAAAGQGHLGYELVSELEKLYISNSKKHKDFRSISCSTHLKDVTLMQCGIQSLDGIEKHLEMHSLALYHNRSLKDISALAELRATLRTLAIENCPQIKDFSVLDNLVNLEHLHLYGTNHLLTLNFLNRMPKLKTFTFTMDVDDGDLRPCLNIPYASCKNRKHYNYKDSQLPKNLRK